MRDTILLAIFLVTQVDLTAQTECITTWQTISINDRITIPVARAGFNNSLNWSESSIMSKQANESQSLY